jgi:hypothetical protein
VKVSDPSDRIEREAVANADWVMASAPPVTHDVQPSADGAVPMVQREEAEPEEEDPDNLAAAQTFVRDTRTMPSTIRSEDKATTSGGGCPARPRSPGSNPADHGDVSTLADGL